MWQEAEVDRLHVERIASSADQLLILQKNNLNQFSKMSEKFVLEFFEISQICCFK